MARVEWTRQSGDDVETVVAMLLCCRFPNAVRVRPSQGDGGVDVFVPGPAGFGKERAVYQVKKYSLNLTSSQKRKIKLSYQRVVEASEKEGWRITQWHLVMPLDLTSQNLGWLDTLTAHATFPCEPNGLVFCDTLAAHYPKAIDYYLRDGKDRLQDAMNNFTAILSGRRDRAENDALQPDDVMPDLASTYKSLNACDPFYRYEFSASENPPAIRDSPSEEGLIGVYAIEQESVWVTIKIFALSLAALEESPITVQFKIAIPHDDDELRQQFEKFIEYGAPLSLPMGTVSGSLDLPAGLGGPVETGSVQVISIAENSDPEEAELLFAMLDPDDDGVIASAVITRVSLTAGEGGFRSLWRDEASLFTIELLTKDTDVKMSVEVDYNLAGRKPSDFIRSLQFLAAMHKPNRFGIGLPYGPPNLSNVGGAPDDKDRETKKWALVADALLKVQDHVPVLLRMPPEMSEKEAHDIVEASKLVSGEVLTGKMSGEFAVHHPNGELTPNATREPDTVYEFAAIKQVEIVLGDQTIHVCKEMLQFLGQFVAIEESSSVIRPVSDGVSMLYTGDTEARRVFSRDFRGVVTVEVDERGMA